MVRRQAKTHLLLAPAKLNLGLRIVGRRADGYHELESLFWPVALSDKLWLQPAEKHALRCEWMVGAIKPGPLPEPGTNVVDRLLQSSFAASMDGWSIHLKKQIPIAAGLGGGSSNAGILLRFLGQTHPQRGAECRALAETLGADVPFFLDPKPTWVTGIGEKQDPISVQEDVLEGLRFLLVFPPVGCSTQRIFAEYRKRQIVFSPRTPFRWPSSVSQERLFSFLRTEASNDLEPLVRELEPGIDSLLERLSRTSCVYSGLTGSGSTCFAIFENDTLLTKATKELRPFFRKHNCKSLCTVTFR